MSKTYTHKGFADFSRGTMGNGGQNLYVSRKGVLQRIFNFDTTNNGYFDIMITNSHDYSEKPPLSLISDPTGPNPIERKVLTDGYPAVVVADINNDGYTISSSDQDTTVTTGICRFCLLRRSGRNYRKP